MSRRCSSVLVEIQSVIGRLLRDRAPPPDGPALRLLDVGCWDGGATLEYARLLRAVPSGIEVFEQPAAGARARGVEVARVDLECGTFPWPDASFDFVVANQVLEHLKNIWLPVTEIHRVLKPGGTLIASVPNLASLHNRVLSLLGMQPTSIRTFGPHVRGFTRGEFTGFIAHLGAFAVERSIGVGFYPLPTSWARGLAWLWPGASHTVVVVARKNARARPGWLAHLDSGDPTFYGGAGAAGTPPAG